jgi:hypothetical protein
MKLYQRIEQILYHFGFWILDFRLAKGCHQRVSQIDLSHPSFKLVLLPFRSIFRREATFEWFVLLFWGVLLSTQPPAVTSYLNALGLGEGYYHQALHWFHSSAFCVDTLCAEWGKWLSDHRIKIFPAV